MLKTYNQKEAFMMMWDGKEMANTNWTHATDGWFCCYSAKVQSLVMINPEAPQTLHKIGTSFAFIDGWYDIKDKLPPIPVVQGIAGFQNHVLEYDLPIVRFLKPNGEIISCLSKSDFWEEAKTHLDWHELKKEEDS